MRKQYDAKLDENQLNKLLSKKLPLDRGVKWSIRFAANKNRLLKKKYDTSEDNENEMSCCSPELEGEEALGANDDQNRVNRRRGSHLNKVIEVMPCLRMNYENSKAAKKKGTSSHGTSIDNRQQKSTTDSDE